MLSDKMLKALNDQCNAELYSGYLYLQMSAWFADQNLAGMANWMRIQALEEQSHAGKFFDFIIERGGKAVLQPIEGPPTEWDSPLKAFQDAYKHEQYITGRINDLVALARDEKDYATEGMLQWFVNEQVEEEANADANVKNLQMVQGDARGLFMVDREMKARAFVMPAPSGEGE